MHQNVNTLGKLKDSGWVSKSVKDELRDNLILKLRDRENLFPGIYGYDKTVIPQVIHSILSRHDLILLGLRGQAKTRILRMLPRFLDEYIPVVEGSEINDDPLRPISKYARNRIREEGDDTPITWLHRDARYSEKLATPDTTVADLIGDLDPIKAASKKLSLASEDVINFGLIPRTHRGIFVINELPDLQPRIQVALLNIMQEKDIQIRGFNVRIPLDVVMAFSANPEDYTSRGNIITPLKDRINSQIITHYPFDIEVGKQITREEAWTRRDGGPEIIIPALYRDVIETVAFEARRSEYIDQKSGVSARMTITAMEQAISSAERRAMVNNEAKTTLRVSDLFSMVPALTGKLELVYEGEQEGAVNVAKHLIGLAIKKTFSEYFPDSRSRVREAKKDVYETVLKWFNDGNIAELPWDLTDEKYEKELQRIDGLKELAEKKVSEANPLTSLMDLILEGLHQHSKVGKTDLDDARQYNDMLGSMLGGMDGFGEDDEDNMEF